MVLIQRSQVVDAEIPGLWSAQLGKAFSHCLDNLTYYTHAKFGLIPKYTD